MKKPNQLKAFAGNSSVGVSTAIIGKNTGTKAKVTPSIAGISKVVKGNGTARKISTESVTQTPSGGGKTPPAMQS